MSSTPTFNLEGFLSLNNNNAKINKGGALNKKAQEALKNSQLNGLKYINKNQVQALKTCEELRKTFENILKENNVDYKEFFIVKNIE